MPPENPDMDADPEQNGSRSPAPVKPPRTRWFVRAVLLAIGVGLAAVFAVAAYLDPYGPDGPPGRWRRTPSSACRRATS